MPTTTAIRARCPVCERVVADVFQHTNMEHPDFYWSQESIAELRANASPPTKQSVIPPSSANKPLKAAGARSCPICMQAFQHRWLMLLHVRHRHADRRWTADSAAALGLSLCGCGTLLSNSTDALKVHRHRSGCRQQITLPGSQSRKPAPRKRHQETLTLQRSKQFHGVCPICHKFYSGVLRHAILQHPAHDWTAAEAEAIGGYACACGTLLSNAGANLQKHRKMTGCRSAPAADKKPFVKNLVPKFATPAPADLTWSGMRRVTFIRRDSIGRVLQRSQFLSPQTIDSSAEQEVVDRKPHVGPSSAANPIRFGQYDEMVRELQRTYPSMSTARNAKQFWSEGLTEYEFFLSQMSALPPSARISYYPSTNIELIGRVHGANPHLLPLQSEYIPVLDPDLPALVKSQRYARLYDELLSKWHQRIVFWWPIPESISCKPSSSFGPVSGLPATNNGRQEISVTVVMLDGTRALFPVFRNRNLRFVLTTVSLQGNFTIDLDGVCACVNGRRIIESEFERAICELGLHDGGEINLLPLVRFF